MRARVSMAVAVGLVFYSLGDVLLWARIFEANHLSQYDPAYQTGHREILLGLIAVGVVLLWDAGAWALWWALSLYTLAWGGAADLLYYVLDGRAIPATLPWLNDNRLIWPMFKPVTNSTLLLNVGLWVAVCVVAMIVAPTLTFRAKSFLSLRTPLA